MLLSPAYLCIVGKAVHSFPERHLRIKNTLFTDVPYLKITRQNIPPSILTYMANSTAGKTETLEEAAHRVPGLSKDTALDKHTVRSRF